MLGIKYEKNVVPIQLEPQTFVLGRKHWGKGRRKRHYMNESNMGELNMCNLNCLNYNNVFELML